MPVDVGPHDFIERDLAEANKRLRIQLATATQQNKAMERDVAMWEADARTLLAGFDQGVFVRSIAGDDDPAWAIKLMPYIMALARLQERCDTALSASQSDKGDEGGLRAIR